MTQDHSIPRVVSAMVFAGKTKVVVQDADHFAYYGPCPRISFPENAVNVRATLAVAIAILGPHDAHRVTHWIELADGSSYQFEDGACSGDVGAAELSVCDWDIGGSFACVPGLAHVLVEWPGAEGSPLRLPFLMASDPIFVPPDL